MPNYFPSEGTPASRAPVPRTCTTGTTVDFDYRWQDDAPLVDDALRAVLRTAPSHRHRPQASRYDVDTGIGRRYPAIAMQRPSQALSSPLSSQALPPSQPLLPLQMASALTEPPQRSADSTADADPLSALSASDVALIAALVEQGLASGAFDHLRGGAYLTPPPARVAMPVDTPVVWGQLSASGAPLPRPTTVRTAARPSLPSLPRAAVRRRNLPVAAVVALAAVPPVQAAAAVPIPAYLMAAYQDVRHVRLLVAAARRGFKIPDRAAPTAEEDPRSDPRSILVEVFKCLQASPTRWRNKLTLNRFAAIVGVSSSSMYLWRMYFGGLDVGRADVLATALVAHLCQEADDFRLLYAQASLEARPVLADIAGTPLEGRLRPLLHGTLIKAGRRAGYVAEYP